MRLVERVNQAVIGCAFTFFALLASTSGMAAEPQFPNGPVKIVVPFPAGGPTDVLVRVIQKNLQNIWSGVPVIILTKPGGDTIIGANVVAKSNPDGQTLGVVVSSYAINPALHKNMPYDTLKDLAGVTQLVNAPLVLVARSEAPYSTVAQLIAYAKRNPTKLTYGTPGSGTSTHLAGELFKSAAGIDILHVPYQGSVPAQIDLVGGRIDLMFDVFSSALPMIQSGKLKVIGLTLGHRLANYETYPTVAETIPGFDVSAFIGVVAPAATAKPILLKIQTDIAKAMSTPDVQERLASFAMERVASTPEQFDLLIRSELTRWGRIVKDNNIHVN